MIPKDNIEAPPRSDYEKPAENSRPNQIVNPIPIGRGNKNIYQIDENDISNSIDINYEINMDINNPNMHFSNINFENIDRKKIVNNSDPAI